MKHRHTVALALVLVLGCPVGASSWHIVQAPHRECAGPRDPGMFDCLHPGAGQCFDTHAALNKWSRVGADFDSKQDCDARLDTIRTGGVKTLACAGAHL